MSYDKKGILIASKHQKEKVIAPIFKKYLACDTFTSDFDTDQLGTFTGEIPRLKDPISTCKDKAILAAQHLSHPYALASEGSFGAHPLIPFLPFSEEWMVFVDLELGICVQEELKTQETNYQTKFIQPDTDLKEFLSQVHFPSHALCLQTSASKLVIAKGIQSHEILFEVLKKGFAWDDQLLLSTDMRAMMNPTRMKVIKKLAKQLALRIQRSCPTCQTPGFGQQGVSGNLCCEQCHLPSAVYAFELWGCVKCDYQEQKARADRKVSIAPQFCQFCNP